MTAALKKLIPLLVFVGAFFIIQQGWRIQLWLDPVDHSALSASDVVMYSTSWCPYCRKARQYFEQADIPYAEYDVEKSARAMAEYQQLSGRGVPVIQIGSTVVQGFDASAIRTAIEQLLQQRQANTELAAD